MTAKKRVRETRRRAATSGLAVMLLPAFLLIACLLLFPLLEMVYASLHQAEFGSLIPGLTFANYAEILDSQRYLTLYGSTLFYAGCVTALCAVLGYPVAFHLTRASARWRGVLYFIIVAPLLINAIVRTYGWLLVLDRHGILNSLLLGAGLIKSPLVLTGNAVGMVIGATQVFLPFMILSIATSLQSIDPRLLESSEILGASPLRTFWRVQLPLSMPGVIAGSILVFSLMLGAFVTPLVLGGSTTKYLSVAVYTDALVLFNLPRATALAMVLLVIVAVIFLVQSALARRSAPA